MVGVALISLAFLNYLKNVFANRANLSKLNFIGFLMTLNILVILGIFTMFWFSVKLIPTLWILAAISPISFFIINKGLISADCSIAEYKTPRRKVE